MGKFFRNKKVKKLRDGLHSPYNPQTKDLGIVVFYNFLHDTTLFMRVKYKSLIH